MAERSGQFRVYRVVPSVHHLNFQSVGDTTLYTVYQSGYGSLQSAVDSLETGALIEATLEGDPTTAEDPWHLTGVEYVDGLVLDFAVDVALPSVARRLWGEGRTHPTWTTLTDEAGNAVGACGVQPRDPLPNRSFVPSVVTGLLPLEGLFASVPELNDPATEVLFLDPDVPAASTYTQEYGVVLAFTEPRTALADEYRDSYDLPRGEDSRPDFDPYAF
jgi:hypothetical protein